MTPRPQLDEDQMALMDAERIIDSLCQSRMRHVLQRSRDMFRQMGCETMAKECEEALK